MWRRTGFRVAGALICIATLAAAAVGPAAAAPPPGPGLAPRSHGFMLYFSQSMGGGAAGLGGPRFGFRLEQVRLGSNNGAPDAGDPMQHRSLVGWQFGGARTSDMHLELGGRVTYDIRHGGFALQSSSRFPQPARSRSSVVSATALRGSKPFDTSGPDEHSLMGKRALSGGGMRESASLLHEIASAAVLHLRPSPLQQRERQGNAPR